MNRIGIKSESSSSGSSSESSSESEDSGEEERRAKLKLLEQELIDRMYFHTSATYLQLTYFYHKLQNLCTDIKNSTKHCL